MSPALFDGFSMRSQSVLTLAGTATKSIELRLLGFRLPPSSGCEHQCRDRLRGWSEDQTADMFAG